MKKLIFLILFVFSFSLLFSQTRTVQKMYVQKKYGQIDSILVSDISKITFNGVEYPVGTLFDIDGNAYSTVIIGNQEWTVENLRVTRYNDGQPIEKVLESASWIQKSTGAYCAYDNAENNVLRDGYLYNWFAVSTGKLAPTDGGWRVPSDADWTILDSYINDANEAGKKLRSTTGWNHNGTNIYGFNGLPTGKRDENGSFTYGSSYSFDFACYWWSTSESISNRVWMRWLHDTESFFYRSEGAKILGHSVRLVRDL